MNYRKQLAILTSVAALVFIVTAIISLNTEWSSCISYYEPYFTGSTLFLRCLDVSLFAEPQQYISLMSLSILLSLIPLFFLKEAVYFTWQKFAAVFLPLAILFILNAPSSVGTTIGGLPTSLFDRELASMFSAAIFLIISIGIMVVKTWKLRGKGEDGENVPVHKKDNSEL